MTSPSPGFPLVAILPDLWTVYRGMHPVSQHASMALATRHAQALGDGHTISPPEHSPVVIAKAREAIRKAQERVDPRAHWVTCTHCQLWHDPDEDCPPARRHDGYYHEDDPT